MAPKKKEETLQQKSPAEFFAENKNIAGFDNPGKCLYTSMRELVENSLDAAESVNALPEIDVTIEEISQERMNTIRGVANMGRRDEELYHDYETEDQKQKRVAKEAKEMERAMKAAAKKGEGAAEAERRRLEARRAADRGRAAKTYYRLTVTDNGVGMAHDAIPDLLGRVLSGTKYGVCQTRGKFGLGAKMALIWSKMSTGLPIEVRSARQGSATVSEYRLDIDIHRNEPCVHAAAQVPNTGKWRGSQLSVTILGNWQYYRAKILKYLRQIAVITPYAQFTFSFAGEGGRGSFALRFARRTDAMPAPPTEVKHHPASVDLELVKRLLTSTKATSMRQFLAREFSCVSRDHAERLAAEVRSGVGPDTDPHTLDSKQAVRLHQLLHDARFPDPDGSHLAPAGEYNLRLGVVKELRPDLVATHQGDVRVLEGHAFAVEAAVSLGGRDIKPGLNVYRFANRIPLLFEGGSDVITKTAAKRINWGAYKINHVTDKVGVFVSVVSTKIPYKGAGKEYVADELDDMVAAVKSAIQACCVQLKVKIARALAAREQKQRRASLTRYVPNAAAAVFKVLEAMADTPAVGPKRRRLEAADGTLAGVRSGEVSEEVLAARLAEYVERVDTDLALEYQMQQGLAGGGGRTEAWLVPQGSAAAYGRDVRGCGFALRLLQP